MANDWAQFQHDSVHSGTNPAETAFNVANVSTGPLTIKFRDFFGSNTTNFAGAVEADGVLYVPDSGSEATNFFSSLWAFNAAGCGGPVGGICQAVWKSIPLGGSIATTPAVSNGFVIIASRENTEEAAPFLFGFAAGGCGASICPPVWRGVTRDLVLARLPRSPTASSTPVTSAAVCMRSTWRRAGPRTT